MSFQKGNTFVFGETPSASKWDQLWRNDDALADGSGLADNSISFAKLLSTIFSGQVQTGSNSGSAGGSYSYINLGGIKLLWGKTAHMNTAEPRTVSLPASFFNSVTAAIVAAGELTSDGRQIAYISSAPTTSSLIIQLILAAGGAGNGKVSYLVIGT